MLEVKNLKKKFGNNLVLKGIDLKVNECDKIAIIGPSGCGKSTFLRCLNGIEKPTSGKIIFKDMEITNTKDLSNIRKKIGMVFQQFNLFPHLTVEENIILAPVKLKILTEKEAKKKARELLASINLSDKKNSYPDELSGGQKQRVAIVRSLIMNPDILLFDEPTSALDPEMVGEVLELIKEIADKGMTMIIVSHEMNFVKKCANKVVFMDGGKISFSGTVEEVFNNKDNIRLKVINDVNLFEKKGFI